MKKKKLIISATGFTFLLVGSFYSFKEQLNYGAHQRANYMRSPASIDHVEISLIEKKREDVAKISLRLEMLEQCYNEQVCGFDQSDSRSYALAVGSAISKELNEIYDKIQEGELVDSRYEDLANHYLKIPDGHVKEEALNILSTQPPSQKSFETIVDYALLYHDDALIEQSMTELLKYKETHENEIMNSFSKVLSTSSPMVREKLGSHIFPFLNERTYDQFITFSTRLPKGSKTQIALKAAIRKYRYTNRL
ncbi:hypothetical protein HBN50_11585 [Halobacteriovorax sp. GB3]|uniref:hypothetical protein n=1 Tax=Halobacteriovorax sp. GB3 TaxID=2719615 RepID=UPI0023617869|nr:hypothetical protein [Halobacteriovorax sp. GB3]MDD0853743.1 hypothetical protein [Halobacteriovorax sp. GB3]